MNKTILIILLIHLNICFAWGQNAEPGLFDDFDYEIGVQRQSDFGVTSTSLRTRYVSPLNEVPTQRGLHVFGISSDWTLKLENESGYLSFENHYEEGFESRQLTILGLLYSRLDDQVFTFLGINAFSVEYELNSGIGSIEMYVNFPDVSEPLISKTLLSQSGTTLFQFQETDLNNAETLYFRIYPESKDFSITLNSIHAIPESTTLSLLLLGGAPWAWRRAKQLANRNSKLPAADFEPTSGGSRQYGGF